MITRTTWGMGDDALQEDMKVNMTPMIDVVFMLMIFFFCTIKFKTLEGKLSAYLPRGVGVNANPMTAEFEKIEIVIKVLKEGSKLKPLSDEPYPADGSGPFRYGPDRQLQFQVGSVVTTSIDELATRLDQLHQAQPGWAVTLDPKGGTTYADIVLVLNRAVLAGFSEITFKGSRGD